jgi:hypothetical protein
MDPTSPSSRDVEVMRESAARLVTRLGLSGFDNESILKADAWVDSPEFRAAWEQKNMALVHDLAAYLGEAVIRRHGGKWSFSQPGGPAVQIKRNGVHFIEPFAKVQKRVLNGPVDQLLGLVNLVGEVAARLNVDAVGSEAQSVLQASGNEGDGSVSAPRFFAYGCVALVVFPLVLLVVLLLVLSDKTDALIGAGCGVPLGLVGLVVFLRRGTSKAPAFAPGTLGFEAQLTLPLLQDRLAEKLASLGPQPAQEALAEVRFYTTQVEEVQGILARRDRSPGRGYVGFDTYGAAASSWTRAGAGGPG